MSFQCSPLAEAAFGWFMFSMLAGVVRCCQILFARLCDNASSFSFVKFQGQVGGRRNFLKPAAHELCPVSEQRERIGCCEMRHHHCRYRDDGDTGREYQRCRSVGRSEQNGYDDCDDGDCCRHCEVSFRVFVGFLFSARAPPAGRPQRLIPAVSDVLAC